MWQVSESRQRPFHVRRRVESFDQRRQNIRAMVDTRFQRALSLAWRVRPVTSIRYGLRDADLKHVRACCDGRL
jgi:hypothetical protein